MDPDIYIHYQTGEISIISQMLENKSFHTMVWMCSSDEVEKVQSEVRDVSTAVTDINR